VQGKFTGEVISDLKHRPEGIRVKHSVNGHCVSALNPWSEKDAALLQAVSRGEYAINGLRNRDLRRHLWSSEGSQLEERRRAAAVTRQLRLLRAHGLVRKVSGTHRYVLTESGRKIITALLAARQADVEQLTALAA
jgi:DNA-binding MarR family transcriptional regulator